MVFASPGPEYYRNLIRPSTVLMLVPVDSLSAAPNVILRHLLKRNLPIVILPGTMYTVPSPWHVRDQRSTDADAYETSDEDGRTREPAEQGTQPDK